MKELVEKAKELEAQGKMGQAVEIYLAVAAEYPRDQAVAKHLVELEAMTGLKLTNPPRAGYVSATVLKNVEEILARASRAEADEYLRKTLSRFPNSPELLKLIARSLLKSGRFLEAIDFSESAIAISPADQSSHSTRSSAYLALGLIEHAQHSIKTIEWLSNSEKNEEEAKSVKERYEKLRQISFSIGEHLIPTTLTAREALLRKKDCFDKLKHATKISDFKLVVLLSELTLLREPKNQNIANVLGSAYTSLGDFENAIKTLKNALALNPQNAKGLFLLGNIYAKKQMFKAAGAYFNQAVKLDPKDILAWINRGITFRETKQFLPALNSFKKAAQLNPRSENAAANMLILKVMSAEWSDWETKLKAYRDLRRSGVSDAVDIDKFKMLLVEDNPGEHLARARLFSKSNFPKKTREQDFKRPAARPDRLTVAYVSGDFRQFPGMVLMAGVLEHHDRDNFEVIAVSHGPDIKDKWRDRIEAAVDQFIDIKEMPDLEAAELLREKRVDIAVNRNGYTNNHRTALFYHRIAPIQVNYLGYPCTMGADFMDYIVADRTLIPEESKKYYSENIIYMPDSYQPNDLKRPLADTPLSRAECSLPDEKIVCCCFNQTQKITPDVFSIWMSLLSKCDRAVLWLLEAAPEPKKNILKEATKHGIDASRIIFAPRVSLESHLSRQVYADIFLDTFHYNAHTTASDALWAGVPVVTKIGHQFSARVAASILGAHGCSELVANSDDEYRQISSKLILDDIYRTKIRAKIVRNIKTHPLFDIKRYTSSLEQGYLQAYQKFLSGAKTEDIYIN